MLLTWFILAGFIVLFSPQNLTNKCQLAFARMFRWPLSVGRSISLSATTKHQSPDSFHGRETQYQNHIANLIAQRDQAYQQLEILTELKSRFDLEGAKLLPTGVTRASSNGHNELIIDRGKDDGLEPGQFVLAYNSIIGVISSVEARGAWVKLITAQTSKIPVFIKTADTNINRIMTGSGNNSAKISMIETKHKINIGDFVYARRMPGFLGAPIVIGKIAQCQVDARSPSLWDITVEPACDIKKLDYLDVIIMNPKQ